MQYITTHNQLMEFGENFIKYRPPTQSGSNTPNLTIENKDLFESAEKGGEKSAACLAFKISVKTEASVTSAGLLKVGGKRSIEQAFAIISKEGKAGTLLWDCYTSGKEIKKLLVHRLASQEGAQPLYTYTLENVKIDNHKDFTADIFLLSFTVKRALFVITPIDNTGVKMGNVSWSFNAETGDS